MDLILALKMIDIIINYVGVYIYIAKQNVKYAAQSVNRFKKLKNNDFYLFCRFLNLKC